MERILACLDGSARAPHVLATAIELARRIGARVRLFRAVGIPPELPDRVYQTSPNDLPKMLLEDAKTQLMELSRSISPELLDGVYVRLGQPWDAICRAAIEQSADLIVIGSHGYGGIDRVLGTTAAKVVNHADRSVLVVRQRPA
jgi:universal stress protein F